MKTQAEQCIHPALTFGSGDYYLFCHDCGRVWATINNMGPTPDGHRVSPEMSNRGVGAQLSGTIRVLAKDT